MFCFDNPRCFAKTFEEEKKTVFLYAHNMHVNTMFTVLVKSTYGVDRRIRDVDSCHKATVFSP